MPINIEGTTVAGYPSECRNQQRTAMEWEVLAIYDPQVLRHACTQTPPTFCISLSHISPAGAVAVATDKRTNKSQN